MFRSIKLAICKRIFHGHTTMLKFLIPLLIFHISSTQCGDSESTETNGIDVTPFYSAIIFSDIADIINEFESNINQPSDINSESESDENMEDLLSEYQHYLDKAHKQKQIYLEKSKTKNKVPLSRHDNFIKTKNNAYKNDSFRSSYFNPNLYKFSQTKNKNPLDFFIPLHFKTRYPTKTQVIPEPTNIYSNMNLDKTIDTQNKILDLPLARKSLDQTKTSCCCKTDQLPCDYNCKQCLPVFKTFTGNNFDFFKMSDKKKIFHFPASIEGFFKTTQFNMVDKVNSIPSNIMNLRIKVDISLPKTPDYYSQNLVDNTSEHDGDFSKETPRNVNMPLSYYNIPMPTDMFGYKNIFKFSKPDSASLHKMTIHKKKKSRVNNGNKKHRKKLITFHNINLEPQQFFNIHNGNNDMRNRSNNNNNASVLSIAPNVTEKTEHIWITHMPNNTVNTNNNQTHEEIFLTLNITKNEDKPTEDIHKNENSIENEYTTKINLSARSETTTKLRHKRNVSFKNRTAVLPVHNNHSQVAKVLKITKNLKKNDKMLSTDNMLLYWPNNYRNRTDVQTKNITAIILMRENKKAKLNISNETIRRNHTQALEQAIFGEVNWNDVDTVVPTFMSFVGKYITGALTFCSEIICHSMKCVDKNCVHRICAPEERLNNIGHCAGSQNTDSVASMESIMDLPSNVAFEIVDILQDKMLGKIFGKMTLCITSKCISMAAYKKIFKKTKCAIKELYSTGHCPDTKTLKMP